jgi:putative endonuclease
MASERQRRGLAGESEAAEHLLGAGWRVIARNVRVGRGSARDEIDLLCVDPGPPPALVLVEVRSARSAAFGAPEERVDRHKVRRLYRALSALTQSGRVPVALAGLPLRIDLVVVDHRAEPVQIRHLRGLAPP